MFMRTSSVEFSRNVLQKCAQNVLGMSMRMSSLQFSRNVLQECAQNVLGMFMIMLGGGGVRFILLAPSRPSLLVGDSVSNRKSGIEHCVSKGRFDFH